MSIIDGRPRTTAEASEIKSHDWHYSGPDPAAVVPPESKASTVNPKDLLGIKKPSITKIPMAALLHCAMAMMEGARKYGAYNWRAKKVVASIYIDAMFRHAALWFDSGEEVAEDSGVHHLGHAMACCAILLDAAATGNLVDDRPITPESKGKLSELMNSMSELIKKKMETPA